MTRDHHEDHEDTEHTLPFGMTNVGVIVAIAWILQMVVTVVVLYYTNQFQGERNLQALKDQQNLELGALKERVNILEHDKERDNKLLDSRHEELKSQISAVASQVAALAQGVESLDQFTQRLYSDMNRPKVPMR